MTVYAMLYGFFTALVCFPTLIAKQIYACNLGGNDPEYQSIEEAMRFYQVCNELWNSIATKLHNNKTINFPSTMKDKDYLIDWLNDFLYVMAYLPDD